MSNVRASIEATLAAGLRPSHLEVIDESHMHNVPPGSESHFRVRVVTEAFDGKRLVQRHREVSSLIAELYQTQIHALALETHTPEEWAAKGGVVMESPPCLGGEGEKK